MAGARTGHTQVELRQAQGLRVDAKLLDGLTAYVNAPRLAVVTMSSSAGGAPVPARL